MRIVISQQGHERVFFVTNVEPTTILREVLESAQVDLRHFKRVWVDGREVDQELSIREVGLCEGAVVANTPQPYPGESLNDESMSAHHINRQVNGRWQLVIVGGSTCARVYDLPASGPARVGRSAEAEISLDSASVSWSHAVVNVTNDGVHVIDHDSSNGTYLNGRKIGSDHTQPTQIRLGDILSIGGVCLMLVDSRMRVANRSHANSGKMPTAGAGGLIAFNRPPRTALPPHAEQISVPARKDSPSPAKFSWVAIVAPLLMAVLLVLVLGSMRYALIALLSPVMAVGSWTEQKRRNKSSDKDNEQTYLADLEKTRGEIEQAACAERSRTRAQVPYPHELVDAATGSTSVLWQVRRSHRDFYTAAVGTANIPFTPTPRSHSGPMQPRTKAIFDHAVLRATPLIADLQDGPIGIWGSRDECLCIARSLVCQLTTLSGPADFRLAVATDEARAEDWRFTAWLPHTQTGSTNPHERFIALDTTQASSMLRGLRDLLNTPEPASMLIVVDDLALTQGRDCPLRDILEYRPERREQAARRFVSAIIIAPTVDQLPSVCHTVVHAKTDNEVTVTIPSQSECTTHVTAAGVDADTARDWARRLARYDDPSVTTSGGGLPGLVHLFDVLGFNRTTMDASTIVDSWHRSTDPDVPLGVCDDGTFVFDLVKDGPHGLVGGTTGSGKSELLRSLVAGLAARVDPQHLTFILIDFKGGAAFASLNQLPHTIGTLSNLEPSLAFRALQALNAELKRRQQCFADAGEGIDNLDAYLATNPAEPMPRLLLVIDEFAQLAKEYPDVLSGLVSLAAVGRTLGVHMILATQRPDGVVNDDILANTNMRTALRVQSREQSTNVIGVPLAASIGREQKGRAYIKLGEEDITPIQTALVTGVSGASTAQDLHVDPMILGNAPKEHTIQASTTQINDMDLLIQCIIEANELLGFAPARRVWPEPLSGHVELVLKHYDSVTHRKQQVVSTSVSSTLDVALFDDPEHQRQYISGWKFATENLVLAGMPGSGTSGTLIALALRIADTYPPGKADIVILDVATASLDALQKLTHVRGYAGPGHANRQLQARVLRYVATELDQRSAHPHDEFPLLFILVDGFATLREEYADVEDMKLIEGFHQVWAKGPAMGIHCVVTTTRLKALPPAISDLTGQKWLYQLADTSEYHPIVDKDNHPANLPGRFVSTTRAHHGHVGLPDDVDATMVAINEFWGVDSLNPLVQEFPEHVGPEQLVNCVARGSETWQIPIGINETDLTPYTLEAFTGEHVLISGPARSGKSTMLAAIHQMLIQQYPGIDILVSAPRRSPLGQLLPEVMPPDQLLNRVAEKGGSPEPCIIMIDDAHMIADESQVLTQALNSPESPFLFIVSGRNNDLRSLYSHWTGKIRKSRLGVLLVPDTDYDGDLLGVRLPRHPRVTMSEARGYGCQNGTATLIQGVTASVRSLR